APGHPYTRALLAAVPSGVSRGTRLTAPGHPLPPRSPDRSAPVLTASGLSFAYGSRTAVDGVSFTLHRGETLGIVGESGSGKTTLARLVLGLLTPRAGEVRLHGRPWSGVPERERRPRRRAIQLIAQNPLESFDPRHTVARLLADPLARLPRAERRARVLELADIVALPRDVHDPRPRELSGAARQRVAIARALAGDPDVLVCDEPVSALDVSIQAQVLDLLAELQAARGTALLFISHDLGVVHHLSDRVLVMRDGRVVEEADADEIF